jgi:hypothetical protein
MIGLTAGIGVYLLELFTDLSAGGRRAFAGLSPRRVLTVDSTIHFT